MNPLIIFVLGTSCSGKSSFIKTVNKNDYIYLDDARPLYKFFTADQLLEREPNKFQDFIFNNGLKKFYNDRKPHSISVPSGGYRIINPAVWDYILELTAKEISDGNKYMIEFSRGIDPEYVKAFNIQPSEIYKRSIYNIVNNIPDNFIKESLIINMHANLKNRIKRNHHRRECGGHFVSENSMKTIYKSDIFLFDSYGINTGFFELNNFKIPVYSFENKETKFSDKTTSIFLNNYENALDFYRKTRNGR